MRRWVIAGLVLALGLLVAGPASGQVPLPLPDGLFGDPIEPPRPVIVGSGVDELLGLQDQAEGTWLGTYGTGPYGLSSHLSMTDLDHQVQGQWAAYLWSLVVWIARILVALMTWAFTVDLFAPLTGVIDGVVNALASSIWRPLIIPIIILVGLWGAWRGIVRQEVSTLAEGWVWMIAAIAVGLFFFARPSSIATGVNTFTAKVSNTALGAVAAVDPGLCNQGGGKCAGGSAHLAEVTDRLWYLYVIKPYVVMEFGDGDLEEPYLRRLLDAKTVTSGDLVDVGQGGATPDALIEAKAEAYRAVASDLENHGDAYEWFTGRRNYERGMIAGMALVAVLIGGVVLGVIAAGVLLAQLALLLAFLLAPVFLFLGIHPGMGRVVAIRWGQLSLGMVIKRIGLSILLAILLVVSGSIMAAADSAGGWYAAVILHVLLGFAALMYRKPFLNLLAIAAPVGGPRIELRDRASKLKNALGFGFAYAIGRQAVMTKGVQYLTTARKKPAAVTGGGGGGSGGGPTPLGPSGGRGPLPGSGGGRALTVGPGGTTRVANGNGGDGGSGEPVGAGARSRTRAAVAGAAAAGAAAAGAAAGGARSATASSAPTARREAPEVATTATADSPRARRSDHHTPFQRDDQQRIVEPERRRRRQTPAERLQAQREAERDRRE